GRFGAGGGRLARSRRGGDGVPGGESHARGGTDRRPARRYGTGLPPKNHGPAAEPRRHSHGFLHAVSNAPGRTRRPSAFDLLREEGHKYPREPHTAPE